jgi:hypothetical protein
LPGRCLSGCLVAADEADRSMIGNHSTRTWLVRRVNASPDEDHKSVQGAGSTRFAGGPRRESKAPSWCLLTL